MNFTISDQIRNSVGRLQFFLGSVIALGTYNQLHVLARISPHIITQELIFQSHSLLCTYIKVAFSLLYGFNHDIILYYERKNYSMNYDRTMTNELVSRMR